MSFTTNLEIRMCEDRAKEIFDKNNLTENDIERGVFFINKWKQLTGWVEKTECPIFDEKYIL
jgi:hypothetical protein